jgi:nucleoside 2-deoxyribosyltransferase
LILAGTLLASSGYNSDDMAFKVFLSYGMDQESQVTAWRLQTLGTSYGIDVLVPQRNGAQPPPARSKAALAAVQRAIDQSDCVLAIITGHGGPYVDKELNYAAQRRKVIIPIVQQGAVSSAFLTRFPQTFQLSPRQDLQQLTEIMEFLKRQKLSKEKQQQLAALVLAGLGLVFLWAASQK